MNSNEQCWPEEAGGGGRGMGGWGGITQISAKIYCCRSQGAVGLPAVHGGVWFTAVVKKKTTHSGALRAAGSLGGRWES